MKTIKKSLLQKGNDPLFTAIYTDIPVRDQRDTMERPFFSLSKRKRLKPIEYHVGDTMVEVSANQRWGMATIWDADILIWAATQITEALDRGEQPTRYILFHPYNLLKSIQRGTSGRDYQDLRNALERLTHTAVRTNIRTSNKRQKFASFHWLEGWTETVDEMTGKTTGMAMTLSDWLYTGVVAQGGVLTINEEYFLLTGGIERWIYRVARKHAGHQENGWQFTMRQLYEKSGSAARFSDFAINIRYVINVNNIPEYDISLHINKEGKEIIRFVCRSCLNIMDSRFEGKRNPRRRVTLGIHSQGFHFNGLKSSDG